MHMAEKVCNYSLIKFEIERWEVFQENSIKLFTKNKKESYEILNVIGYTSANSFLGYCTVAA